MNRTSWLVIASLAIGLNSGLLLCRVETRLRPRTDPAGPPSYEAVHSAVSEPSASPAPAVAQVPPRFDWSQVEAPDYPTYVHNLRAIRCPEATIRDIVTADVHAAYENLRARAIRPEPGEYWRSGFGSPIRDLREAARLEAEEKALVATVLGPGSGDNLAGAEPQSGAATLRLSSTLAQKRAALEETWNRFEAEKTALLAITEQRDLTEAENARLSALESEQDAALNNVLDRAERAEFDLRNSPSARYLRQTLLGVEVSEQEFGALFEARKEFDARLASASAGGSMWAARQAFEEKAAQLLGPDRWARFERAQEPEFQEFVANGVARGLEAETIAAQWTEADPAPPAAAEP